ncbi:hypothetical protein B0H10DRAFT_2196213 [Mycena sp. CBHHK59/15]|nr:hypothetical protein B0H10DRAFT_2196213 [Mycena sp. CBHHK59/15]
MQAMLPSQFNLCSSHLSKHSVLDVHNQWNRVKGLLVQRDIHSSMLLLGETEHAEQAEIQWQINRIALLPGHSLFCQLSSVQAAADQRVDGAFAAALQRMGLNEESEDEFEEDFPFTHNVEEQDRFPHGSHTMFMPDLLDNLPKLRHSDDHLKAIIWVMWECKTPNVPSFSALHKKQSLLTGQVDIKTEHHTSSLGNHFYMNHASKLLTLARLGKPTEVAGPISESWQAWKWTTEVSDYDLSPMWADWTNKNKSHGHFYIKELARQLDGTYVVPVRWVTVDRVVHADVQYVDHTKNFKIDATRTRRIPASTLESNYLDLCTSGSIDFSATRNGGGRAQRNEAIEQWASDKVSCTAQLHGDGPWPGVTEGTAAIPVPDAWHGAYDCELEQEILFEIILYVLPEDNLVGGTKEYLETNMGYTALYNPSEPQTTVSTLQIIHSQFWSAWLNNKIWLDTSYSQLGVKDKISQYWVQRLHEKAKSEHHTYLTDSATQDVRLKGTALKGNARKAVKEEIKHWIRLELWAWLLQQPDDNFASLALNDSVDPHRDTPIEILHSYLLGNDKYVWHDTMGRPEAKPICCMIATGELRALLWFPERKNMDVYLTPRHHRQRKVPSHIPEDILRFGPILYATEIFECWKDMECFKHMVSSGWWKGKVKSIPGRQVYQIFPGIQLGASMSPGMV